MWNKMFSETEICQASLSQINKIDKHEIIRNLMEDLLLILGRSLFQAVKLKIPAGEKCKKFAVNKMKGLSR